MSLLAPLLHASLALVMPPAILAPRGTPTAQLVKRAASPSMDIDMGVVAGAGALLVGLGGGIGLIALTENAGKRNEQASNIQPCVVCKGAQVVECTVCRGTGSDPLAQYVAGGTHTHPPTHASARSSLAALATAAAALCCRLPH
jgi:hypothetical protein